MFCKICCDAGKSKAEYTNHRIYEGYGTDRRVVCPTLLKNKCHNCGKNGHTTKYCKEEKRDENREYRRRTERAESYMERIPLPTPSPPKRKSSISIRSINEFPPLGGQSKSSVSVCAGSESLSNNLYGIISNTSDIPPQTMDTYIGAMKRFKGKEQRKREEHKSESDECKEDITGWNGTKLPPSSKENDLPVDNADLVIGFMEKIQTETRALQKKVSKQGETIEELRDEIKKLRHTKNDVVKEKARVSKRPPKLHIQSTTESVSAPVPVHVPVPVPVIKRQTSPWKSWHDMSEEYDPQDEDMYNDFEADEAIGVLS